MYTYIYNLLRPKSVGNKLRTIKNNNVPKVILQNNYA